MRAGWIALVLGLCAVALWRMQRLPAGDTDSPRPPASELSPIAEPEPPAIASVRASAIPPPPTPDPDPPAVEPDEDDPPEEEIDEDAYDHAALLAAIGLEADAPVALLIDRFGPPDPLEIGAATLHLTLFDGDTGEPAASPVVLWRLDAPGNEYWDEGDQAVAFEHPPRTEHTFTRLPAGLYRAVCMAERRGVPDPPAFHVAGASEETLLLDLPGERSVRVELYDGREPVVRAELLLGPIESSGVEPAAPAWVAQRRMRTPAEGVFVDEAIETLEQPAPGSWIRVAAGHRGFDLGIFPEDRRDRTHLRLARFRTEAGSADVVIRNKLPRDELPPIPVLRDADVLHLIRQLERR